jgi:hypothetical protein
MCQLLIFQTLQALHATTLRAVTVPIFEQFLIYQVNRYELRPEPRVWRNADARQSRARVLAPCRETHRRVMIQVITHDLKRLAAS